MAAANEPKQFWAYIFIETVVYVLVCWVTVIN